MLEYWTKVFPWFIAFESKNGKIRANVHFYKTIGQKIISQTDKSVAKSR
jgi:hypothetical protein